MEQIVIKNKIFLVTGGTGSLGQGLVRRLMEEGALEIRIFSRDEYKQSEMARHIDDDRLQYWLGDVRDLERLRDACDGVDVIIHAAALKRMDTVSRNVHDLSDINIRGTQNVCMVGKDKRVVFISTDKAYKPESIYGATKMVAEGIALSHNCVVWRFGNFIDSRGSVWEIFKEQKKLGIPFTVTDSDATRFVMSIDEACNYILSNVKPGLYYPEGLKSMTIKEIADSIAPGHPYIIIGLREGDKHDEYFNDNYSSKKI